MFDLKQILILSYGTTLTLEKQLKNQIKNKNKNKTKNNMN